jgi:hypothetical protein
VSTGAAQPVAGCVAVAANFGPVVNQCPSQYANGKNFRYTVVALNNTDWVVLACTKNDNCASRSKFKKSPTSGTIKAPAGKCPCHPHIFLSRGFGYVITGN